MNIYEINGLVKEKFEYIRLMCYNSIIMKNNAINVLREAEEFRSVEGVEGLAGLALAETGASYETERDVS